MINSCGRQLSNDGMSEDGVQGLVDALFQLFGIKPSVGLVFFVLFEVKLPVHLQKFGDV